MPSIFDILGQMFLSGFVTGLGMAAAFATVWFLWNGIKRSVLR